MVLGVFPDRRTSAIWSREWRNLQRVILAQLLLDSGTSCFSPSFPSSVSTMKADLSSMEAKEEDRTEQRREKRERGRASPGLSVAILSPVLLAAATGPW